MLDAYNSTYGCDTGCEYVKVEIICDNCQKEVYIKGEFGEFTTEGEKQAYLDEVTEEDISKKVKEEFQNPELIDP